MLSSNQMLVEAQCHKVLMLAKQMYPHCDTMEISAIKWTKCGRAAGKASISPDRKLSLTFSKECADNNLEEMLNDTVPHEVAHLVVYHNKYNVGLYGWRKIMGHGPEWRLICLALGGTAQRCHNMEVTKARRVTRFVYNLPDGSTAKITKKYHNAVMQNRGVQIKPAGSITAIRILAHMYVGCVKE
jgi:predicted SprT family Zn-dependent metalloprotease